MFVSAEAVLRLRTLYADVAPPGAHITPIPEDAVDDFGRSR